MAQSGFLILRHNDRKVCELLRAVAKDLGHGELAIELNALLTNENVADQSQVDAILELNTVAAESFKANINGVVIQVHRQHTTEDFNSPLVSHDRR
jgi:hypothetical protein